MKKMLMTLLLAGAATLPASAHDFWLLPSDFQMEEAGATKVDFLIGHGTEVGPWKLRWDRIASFRSHDEDGFADQQETIVPTTDAAAGGAMVALDGPGTHVIAFDSYHSFSDLEAEKFNGYTELEGLSQIISYRNDTDTADSNGTELYSRRAKTIVQVGDELTDQPLQPLGQTLEIVPLAHPYGLDDDRRLPVQVLFRGKPLEGALIDLTDLLSGKEPMQSERTDAEGKAVFTVPAEGSWKLNVIWGWPNPGNDRAEFESIFSSLSFGYGEGE